MKLLKEQAELGVPHSKSKLSGPDQMLFRLFEDKMSKYLDPSLPNLGGGWVEGGLDSYRK